MSFSFFDRSLYALWIGKLNSNDLLINLFFHLESFNPDQGATTPSYTDSSSSLITVFLSTPKTLPYPSHFLQAPYGLLNENSSGVGLINFKPSNSNLVENSFFVLLLIIMQLPFPSWSADSIESVILLISLSSCINILSITVKTVLVIIEFASRSLILCIFSLKNTLEYPLIFNLSIRSILFSFSLLKFAVIKISEFVFLFRI